MRFFSSGSAEKSALRAGERRAILASFALARRARRGARALGDRRDRAPRSFGTCRSLSARRRARARTSRRLDNKCASSLPDRPRSPLCERENAEQFLPVLRLLVEHVEARERLEIVGIELQDLLVRVDRFRHVAELALERRGDLIINALLLFRIGREVRFASGRTPSNSCQFCACS